MEFLSHQPEVVSQFPRRSRLFAETHAHPEKRSFEIIREPGQFDGTERVLDSGGRQGSVSLYLALSFRAQRERGKLFVTFPLTAAGWCR